MKFDLMFYFVNGSREFKEIFFLDHKNNEPMTTVQEIRSWLNESQGFVDLKGEIVNLRQVTNIEVIETDEERKFK